MWREIGAALGALVIMFWNVENLFDPFDDPLKNDDEFTARAERHWTWDRFTRKCDGIAQAVLAAADEAGELPAIVGLAEVENRLAVSRLARKTVLDELGYGYVHRESPDERGIDVALLYRRDVLRVEAVAIECTEKLGVKRDLGSFVLSLGATINMDGVAIYLGVTSVFIATCCGIDLTMQQYLALALSATVASVGTPGIPGGSLALMAMVFASAGIPIEGVAIAAGIDRLVDMGRTTMSITGDASCAVVMQRLINRK